MNGKFLLIKLSRYEDSSFLALFCIAKKVIIECCWRSNEREQQEKGKKLFLFKLFYFFVFVFFEQMKEDQIYPRRYLFQKQEDGKEN